MAHTTQITVNGILTDVVEFDSSAQQIDDAVDRTKHYAAENLLDNWDLRGTARINQKGAASYTGTGYGIDRWKITSGAASTVTADADGVYVNISVAWAMYAQPLETELIDRLIGKTLTLSVLTGETVSAGYQLVLRQSSDSYKAVQLQNPNTLYTVTLPITEDADQITVGIQARSASPGAVKLTALKLELGDTQTLAWQDSDGVWQLTQGADPAEQLLRCQRYYQLFSAADKRPAALCDYRPTMRATPATGTVQVAGSTLYFADANL